MTHLVRLDLSKNKLKFLTEDFCNLVNLRHLDLYSNQLENLPVSFGQLNKLRYLDLKGNPLQPALLKIVGPCLTTTDCVNSAKRVVPFMIELEVKFRAEQEKREEEEQRRREEEEAESREQARLAKKAARKERVMKERQKAEAEKWLGTDDPSPQNFNNGEAKVSKSESQPRKPEPSSKNSISFLRLFLFALLTLICSVVMLCKFQNERNEELCRIICPHYQKITEFGFGMFQKVLNLYKM